MASNVGCEYLAQLNGYRLFVRQITTCSKHNYYFVPFCWVISDLFLSYFLCCSDFFFSYFWFFTCFSNLILICHFSFCASDFIVLIYSCLILLSDCLLWLCCFVLIFIFMIFCFCSYFLFWFFLILKQHNYNIKINTQNTKKIRITKSDIFTINRLLTFPTYFFSSFTNFKNYTKQIFIHSYKAWPSKAN